MHEPVCSPASDMTVVLRLFSEKSDTFVLDDCVSKDHYLRVVCMISTWDSCLFSGPVLLVSKWLQLVLDRFLSALYLLGFSLTLVAYCAVITSSPRLKAPAYFSLKFHVPNDTD